MLGLDVDRTRRRVDDGTAVIATPTPSSMTPRFGSATYSARWPWWVRGSALGTREWPAALGQGDAKLPARADVELGEDLARAVAWKRPFLEGFAR
jgi:hypothetical protein